MDSKWQWYCNFGIVIIPLLWTTHKYSRMDLFSGCVQTQPVRPAFIVIFASHCLLDRLPFQTVRNNAWYLYSWYFRLCFLVCFYSHVHLDCLHSKMQVVIYGSSTRQQFLFTDDWLSENVWASNKFSLLLQDVSEQCLGLKRLTEIFLVDMQRVNVTVIQEATQHVVHGFSGRRSDVFFAVRVCF